MRKYDGDIERCRQVGSILNKRVAEIFGGSARKKAANAFARLSNLSYGTAYMLVSEYCSLGPFPQQCSSDLRTYRSYLKQIEHLNRVSKFYQLLGIRKNEPAVSLMREINTNFEYPIKRRNKKVCKIRVKFSEKNLSLTNEQVTTLEELAVKYAIKNRRENK